MLEQVRTGQPYFCRE